MKTRPYNIKEGLQWPLVCRKICFQPGIWESSLSYKDTLTYMHCRRMKILNITVKWQCFRQSDESDVLRSGLKPWPSYSFPLEYKITNGRQVGCICWRQYCINQHCHNDQYSKYQLLLMLALKTLSPTHKGDTKYPYYLMQTVSQDSLLMALPWRMPQYLYVQTAESSTRSPKYRNDSINSPAVTYFASPSWTAQQQLPCINLQIYLRYAPFI